MSSVGPGAGCPPAARSVGLWLLGCGRGGGQAQTEQLGPPSIKQGQVSLVWLGGGGEGDTRHGGAAASTLTGCVSHALAPSPQLSTPNL